MNKTSKSANPRSRGKNSLLRCDARRNIHVPGRVAKKYGSDKSGTVSYAFNASGYRGEDYDQAAKFKICVIGESHAFGTGVDYSLTYAHKFKQHIAKALAEDEADINLINLSVGAASADYCVRTIFRQLGSLDVDLVICQVPDRDRIEALNGGKPESFTVSGIDIDQIDKIPTTLMGYLEFYSPAFGMVNQIKNMLMLQEFLKKKQVGYILLTTDLVSKNTNKPMARPFVDQLDYDYVLRNSFIKYRADISVDNMHAGVRSHAALAIALVDHYSGVVARQGDKNRADQINRYARSLMDNDKDWAFCNEFIARELASEP